MQRVLQWFIVHDSKFFYLFHQGVKCRLLDVLMPRITHLGGATFTLSFLFFIILCSSNPVKSYALQALTALVISHIMVHFVKKAFHRKRPYDCLPNTCIMSHPLQDFSFPSGHTTAAFSIAVLFSFYSIHFFLLMMPIAVLVSLSRIYLGLHYPTDCMIGAFIGSLTSLLTYLIANYYW